MARKPRRKFRRYIRGNINEGQSISALNSDTGVKKSFSGSPTETAWLSSIKAIYSMMNWTGVADAGPISIYLCHSDYTLAEVEEYIEASASGSWSEGDLRTKEIMSRGRLIKLIGAFTPDGGHLAGDTLTLNNGKPLTTKLGWTLVTGATVAMIIYNTGTAAVATTVPEVFVNGHANLWPM